MHLCPYKFHISSSIDSLIYPSFSFCFAYVVFPEPHTPHIMITLLIISPFLFIFQKDTISSKQEYHEYYRIPCEIDKIIIYLLPDCWQTGKLFNSLSNMFVQSPFRRNTIICPIFINCYNFVINNLNERCNMK